jgi:hypothetical protein
VPNAGLRLRAGQTTLAYHFWPGNDRAASVAAAAEFDGDVLAAEEGLTTGFGD